jgi:hypothetical protein
VNHEKPRQAAPLEMLKRKIKSFRHKSRFDKLAAHRVAEPLASEVVDIIREGREGGFDIDRGR